jgi:hypothetical protein
LPVFPFFTHTRTFLPPKRSFLLSFDTLPKKLPLPNALLDLAVYPSTQASFLFGELHLQFFNCYSTRLLAFVNIPLSHLKSNIHPLNQPSIPFASVIMADLSANIVSDEHASPSQDELQQMGNGANVDRKRSRMSAAGDDDDDDDDKPGRERRKIEIKFIQDKSRRHITFSKRKAGIMKKVRPVAFRRASQTSVLGFHFFFLLMNNSIACSR